ncbi:hypothetical protein NOK12_27710 [Nocardioides sp. OK12]|uniref:maleylpyruvate isomerase family mycothiol-dependent enzyme n=1 Tax=Nocardioides sp. OK12 TaxID=2758661 RepID=UPI0021C443A9|nr:maleylpyruvate isomerase family mycothiol-dependent enzyme [Nocardioides sp. OK12]GHJ60253.1 hypothetical protein NOK12_27710 [Nocardioides sp. OK12]
MPTARYRDRVEEEAAMDLSPERRSDTERRWEHIARARLDLADLLEALEPEQWEAQSLCSQWRVREVAGHVAMTPAGEPTTWAVVTGLVRARGHLWSFGRDVAIAWSRRPTQEIVDVLRATAGSRAMPSLTNAENLLLDALVHSQDIAVPLGIDHPVPPDAGADALLRAWRMGWPFWARRRLSKVSLAATDAPVVLGSGPRVEGDLATLLLLTTGRYAAALPRLEGPGLHRIVHLDA